MNEKQGLLTGVRIIDLTRILAGPFCTMMLGDLGADVIKIEAPGKGDDTRSWGPPFTESGLSAYFLSANRNKRSLTLNLKSPEGLRILEELIKKGDVVVDNFKTGTLERLGISYEKMQELRPGMIYCTITGYGYTGPYKDKPGYDFIAQALGGLMSVTGPVDGGPTRVAVAITDIFTGIFASNAILGALFDRERTGRGHRLDLSLLDSQVAMMSYVASNYLVSGEIPRRLGNAHPNIVPYQTFKAKDMHIAFAAGNDSQWAKFCRAVGKDEWVEDVRYARNEDRVNNRDTIVPLLDELFLTRTAAEWITLCEDIGLPAAPINTMDEVFRNEQVVARERLQEFEHPTAGTLPLLASPMTIPTAPTELRFAPPLLGEHTEAILSEMLGMDGESIERLKREGAI